MQFERIKAELIANYVWGDPEILEGRWLLVQVVVVTIYKLAMAGHM